MIDSCAVTVDNKSMPHRTVFQWGKNHAHPFTVFVGGFVIGGLVVGAVVYAWDVANNIDNGTQTNSVVTQPAATKSPKATVSPSVSPSQSPTASPRVQF